LTKRKRKSLSLNLKIVLVTLLALAISVGAFLLTYSVSESLLETLYMSSESVSARKASIYSEFSRYIRDNSINGTDKVAVNRWCSEHKYATVYVYRENTSISRPFTGQPQQDEVPSIESYANQYGKTYPIKFADGSYQIAIQDTSETRESLINIIISLSVGTVLFILIIILYAARMTNRIIALSKQAYIVSQGDLDAPLFTGIGDELDDLSYEMDHLRNSVIDKMISEHKAWQTNAELITAISHDIRTPMTSLIGYLELMNDNPDDADKQAMFTKSAYSKALELKDLTDELFKYFLVFGKSDPKLDNEDFDASMLFGQLLSESVFELEDNGFIAELSMCDEECTVFADPLYLKRIIDNLCSNIKKYADKAEPVSFSTEYENGQYIVRVTNTIAIDPRRTESNKIGLRTCERIAALMHGSFRTERPDGGKLFTAAITLPVVPGQLSV